jgi:hypothetical protein
MIYVRLKLLTHHDFKYPVHCMTAYFLSEPTPPCPLCGPDLLLPIRFPETWSSRTSSLTVFSFIRQKNDRRAPGDDLKQVLILEQQQNLQQQHRKQQHRKQQYRQHRQHRQQRKLLWQLLVPVTKRKKRLNYFWSMFTLKRTSTKLKSNKRIMNAFFKWCLWASYF